MTELQKRVNAINEQVAIARRAVDDVKSAAEIGIDPRGVCLAAANVCAAAVREMDALHSEQMRRDMNSSRLAGHAAAKRFAAKHGTKS